MIEADRIGRPILPELERATRVVASFGGVISGGAIYAALDRLDKSLIEASLDLGASQISTLNRIIMPLAGPGIAAGVMITLVPALGAYLTPDLMGGTDSQMIANVIERQFKRANDWPFGAALSFLLIYAMFIIVAFQSLRRGQPKRGE